ncbi:MAG TPA: molybdate ABC transporter substrate-binding protein [Hyphomicrobium sp.]|nr:molybdate ABC transporter substrate-binding protein [Hyphomicrobium sp.]
MSYPSKTAKAAVRLALASAFLTLGFASHAFAQEKPAAAPEAGSKVVATPNIAAAASLRYSLDEIAERYTKATGKHVKLTYGSTGNLVHQIESGAPFQALFAADDKSVKKLAAAGRTDGEPVIFARGELSVAAPKSSPIGVDSDLKGLREALAAGKVRHVAVANAETAPYGRAAEEALKHAELWEQVKPLLVTGENIGQTATFISTGAAEIGFIARSLAVSAELSPGIVSAVVPSSWHQPINHGLAVIKNAQPETKEFVDFVRGPQGREVLEANGFAVPSP